MGLIVQKFGGTSVANAQRINHVADIIANTYKAGNNVIVVLSAQGDTTDDLIEKANEINPHASRRELDMLLSTGTTWVVLGVTSKPIFTESFLAPGVHPCKGVYGNIASLQSAGSALKWLTQTIGEDDFSKLDAEAEKRRDSAKNIYFYPMRRE